MEHQTETISTVKHLSEYGEMQRSRDFGDKRVYPDVGALRELHEYWTERRLDPDCNERSDGTIRLILGRLSFELTMREQEAE